MGLAAASAFVVLIASGVAVSRLGSDDEPRRHSSEAAPLTGAPEPAADPGSSSAGTDAAAPAGGTVGSAVPSTSAPVPPPAPARSAASGGSGGLTTSSVGSPTSGDDVSVAGADGRASDGSAEERAGADGSSGEDSQPGPQRDPESAGLVAASVSAGEGTGGAVVGVGLGNSPEVDVTVGTRQLVGDAPPSDGTGVGLGGRFLQPPPTIPTLPG